MRCAVRACTAHTHVTKASLKGGIVWPGITSHIIGQVLLSLGHHVRGDNIICVRVLIWDEFGIAAKEAIQVCLGTSTMAYRPSPGDGGRPRARRRVKLVGLGCCCRTLATVLSQAVESLQVVCVCVCVYAS